MRSPLFFKRKKPVSELPADAPRNEYYESISAHLGILQVILFLSLFAFVVIAMLSNTELVTYQNFYYFFQDLGASAERVDIFEGESLSYPTDEEQDFVLYRGGLAVAGNTSVTIFSANGRQLVSSTVQYRDPTAIGAGKYLLVYEMGGTQYSLYNSDAQIHTGKTEFPISGAVVSDSGMYALVTSSADTTSVVSLYTNRFQLINRYNKSGYVMGVAIDAKGEKVAILTSTPNNGLFSTAVTLAAPGEKNAIAETVISSSIGISCVFTEGGKLAALCRDGVTYLSGEGNVTVSHPFEGDQPARFSMGEDGIAVVLKKNTVSSKNIAIVFDKNGEQVYNKTIAEDMMEMVFCNGTLFWMTESGVWREELQTGALSFAACRTNEHTLLAVNDEEALLCSPQKAVYLSFTPQ